VNEAQLVAQAAIISNLTSHREFLTLQHEEEKLQWAAQKDGWSKMADLLLAQRNKQLNVGHNSPVHSILYFKKICANFILGF
jgi:hypothetical protein